MKHLVQSALIECDGCKTTYEDGNGYSIFAEELDNCHPEEYGWYVGEDQFAGQHYCPDCHTIDDDDNLILTPKPHA